MKITPRGSNVLIKPVKESEKTGGLLLPDTHSGLRPNEGTILSVGKSVKDLEKGDKVIFNPYQGEHFKDDKEVEVVLIAESEIYGTYA